MRWTYSVKRVAMPTQRTSTPVASGSSVPAWPILVPRGNQRCARSTAARDVMRLGLSIRGHGYHPAAWRHPDVPAEGTLQVKHYVRSAQMAERGKLDMIFFADGIGIRMGP